MIQYSLKCAEGHSFDSWFQSADAYEKLADAGLVSCAVCGGTDVSKSMMAPRVRPARTTASEIEARPLSTPATPAEQALEKLKKHVEETSDDVGLRFATEARAMHDGDIPERPIHGQARPEDAKKLIEDGVPVLPLPFRPTSKSN